MLRYMIIFSTLLMTAVNVRAQCERPFVGENRIFSEYFDNQIFSDGATIKFKCSTGYTSVSASASRTITCSGTQWSDLELQCKKKTCGHPGEILNGKFLYQSEDGILFGATIKAVCNEGFQLAGQSDRICTETGWSGRTPECEVVKCPQPPIITNGQFEPEEELYDFEEAVTYSCRGGLDLIGPSVSTCSADGTFNPPPPQCLSVSCDRPVIQNAVRVEGKSPPYKYNNFVRYKCNKGYRMEGSDFLTCTENGWHPPVPQCTVITCLKPPALNNGLFKPLAELYQYEQTVTYSCNEGFRLSGASTISCTEDGTFRGSLPECLELTCDAPINRYIEIIEIERTYRFNTTIRYKCVKGYTVEGSDLLTCRENGWNPPPKCKIMTCLPPHGINSGDFNPVKAEYKYQDTVTYSCKKGFKLQGASTVSCTEYGTFQEPPQCVVVTCLPPRYINNGEFNPVKVEYKYQDTVTYSCKKGFKLQGASTVSCTEYGTFQDPPQCVEVTCDEPRHGYIIEGKLNYYVYESSVRVQCNTGYRMEGSDYLTCDENGWDPPPPQCHLNPSIWIAILIIGVLCAIFCVSFYCYKKKRKSENPTHNIWADGTEDGML